MPKPTIPTQIEPLYTRAYFDPATINKEKRTVEVVFATDKPIRMQRWYIENSFDEILSMDAGNVRLERMNSGAPLLDNHDKYSSVIKSQFGVVEKAWTSNGEARAVVRYSKRADVEPVWQDVQDGILKGISCGYRVYEYLITEKDGEVDQYRAIDWEPFEISHTQVPADFTSGIRSDGDRDSNNIVKNPLKTQIQTRNMPENQTPAAAASAAAAAPAAAAPIIEANRAVTEPVNADAIRKEAIAAERKRSADILSAVRAAKLDDVFATDLIDKGTSIDQARALIIEEFSKKDPAKGAQGSQPAVRAGEDEADKRRSGMMEALDFRANFSKEGETKVKGSEYRGMSLMRLAEECVVLAGGKTRGMSNSEIAKAALNLDISRSAGMLSTSDFPIILGNTINRKLLREYEIAPRTFQQWTRRDVATDFKTLIRARSGEFDDFADVKEGGEYKYSTTGEAKEQYVVTKFGRMISVTWETLVNDDLGAFNRLPQKIAASAARKQSDIIYGILTANAALSDGVALFHATHKNLGTAGDIAIASLGEARKLMRNQKGLDSKDFLNLTPSYLVVGPNMETLALQFTSSEYLPNTQSQVNPYKNLTTIVEPRLTGNQWYIMANPGAIDTIEYSFLEGQGELFTETRQGFDIDGIEVKARMVFGAKAIDFRGMVKNAGA